MGYKGKKIIHGTKMKKDCNICTCKAPTAHVGSFMCTNKLCGVTAPPHPSTMRPYTKAEKLRPNVVVTSAILRPTHHGVKTIAKRHVTVAPMTPAPLGGCFLHGKKYKRGESVKRKCKTCVCVVVHGEIYGMFKCTTKKSCLIPTRRTIIGVSTRQKLRTLRPVTRPRTRPTRPHVVTKHVTIVTKQPKVMTVKPVTKKPKVQTVQPVTRGPTKPRVITKAPTKRPVITKKLIVKTVRPVTKKPIVKTIKPVTKKPIVKTI